MENYRSTRIRVDGVLPALVLAGAFLVSAQPAAAQPQVLTAALVNEPVHFDTSPPLWSLPVQIPPEVSGPYLVQAPLRPKLQQLQAAAQQGQVFIGNPSAKPGPGSIAPASA